MGALGDIAQLWHRPGNTEDCGRFGSGNNWSNVRPAVDVCPAGIEVAVAPSTCGGFSQADPSLATRSCEKSPCFSWGVGTLAARAAPRSSRFHSCDQKKKSLSFTTGP